MRSTIQGCNKVRWNKIDSSFDLTFNEFGRFILLPLFLRTVRHTFHVSVRASPVVTYGNSLRELQSSRSSRFVFKVRFVTPGATQVKTSVVLLHSIYTSIHIGLGAHRSAIGWGTALRIRRSRVRWSWGSAQLLTEMSTRNTSWG